MSWTPVHKKDLVQKGQEVLRSVESKSWETQVLAAQVATAYAKLAEALDEDFYYGEV
jgi:hypothetical protein